MCVHKFLDNCLELELIYFYEEYDIIFHRRYIISNGKKLYFHKLAVSQCNSFSFWPAIYFTHIYQKKKKKNSRFHRVQSHIQMFVFLVKTKEISK